ncbi:MAG: hypothetical protein LBG77_01800 [Dysgonamonadaceae bacterium]|nr:hypothetical protein [Dysgonamonadaceae bacterium]
MTDVFYSKSGMMLDEAHREVGITFYPFPLAAGIWGVINDFNTQVGVMLNDLNIKIGVMLNNFYAAVKGYSVKCAIVVRTGR